MAENYQPKLIGEVTHFYNHLGVAIVKFSETTPLHTKVRFIGAHTDLQEELDSMQYDHKPVDEAKKGQEVGVKVHAKVHEKDRVYSID